ncbi:MAG: hypothetical protein ABIS59_01755 [Candidatus Saccharibacteria bacterium]
MLKKLGVVVWAGFALIGITFTGVFVAMQFGLFNVRGENATRNAFFETAPKATVLTKAVGTTSCVEQSSTGEIAPVCAWNKSQEWTVVKAGLAKDQKTIADVAEKTNVDARMISAVVVPEQLRFFTAERETYKKFFEPLKVLGSMTKFSLGVSGMKQDTAAAIERNAVDTNSAFYPGPGFSDLLVYPAGTTHDVELYRRLTDDKSHYYSYLYTALYLKEISAQWSKSGYEISARPDILVTLFNIGFAASKPKDSPQIGGSAITVGGKMYSFGLLGTDYYQSDEMLNLFARN